MSVLTTLAASPFRAPDWRWLRASSIADRAISSRRVRVSRNEDGVDGYKWITTAARFLRDYRVASQRGDLGALAARCPDIFWAYQIWLTDNPLKTIVEAHILARSDDQYIAYRCNTTKATIATYEALFFNVREKLQHRSYVLNCVIGPEVHTTVSEREFRLLWKLYGYFLGPHMIDALEAKFVNPIWCGSAEELNAAVVDDAINTLKFKAAVAAKSVPVNTSTQLAILETFTKFIEIERNTDSAGKAQDQILNHIEAMMSTLPFDVGGRTADGRLRPATGSVDVFKNTAAELTYEETVRMSVGSSVAHRQLIESLRFPEPLPTIEAELVTGQQGG